MTERKTVENNNYLSSRRNNIHPANIMTSIMASIVIKTL